MYLYYLHRKPIKMLYNIYQLYKLMTKRYYNELLRRTVLIIFLQTITLKKLWPGVLLFIVFIFTFYYYWPIQLIFNDTSQVSTFPNKLFRDQEVG